MSPRSNETSFEYQIFRCLASIYLIHFSGCVGDEDCQSDRVITKDLHGHHHDHHHHHHHHDDSPEHRDCPKLCPLIFRPVCGSDGKFEIEMRRLDWGGCVKYARPPCRPHVRQRVQPELARVLERPEHDGGADGALRDAAHRVHRRRAGLRGGWR